MHGQPARRGEQPAGPPARAPWPALPPPRVALVGSSRRADVGRFAARLGRALARAGFELSASGACASVGLAAARGFHAVSPEPERLRLVVRTPSPRAPPALGTVVHAGRTREEVRARLLEGVGALHVQLTRRALQSPAAPRPLRLFYSYAHEDRKLRAVLNKHLQILEREGMLTGWHDGDIGAGREWDPLIREQLSRADVVLLLVSVHFIASSYCAEVEVAEAMARHAAGQARVIPVIVGSVDWSRQPYARLQALPAGGRPVREWASRERAWADVARGVRRALEELRGAAASPSPSGRGPG